MKVSEDAKIREDLKRYEMVNAVDSAARMVISSNEDGEITYEPSMLGFALFYSTLLYFIDGVELEEDDTYETIQSNETVNAIWDDFIEETELGHCFENDVRDVIEYRKKLYLDERNAVLRESARKAFDTAASMNSAAMKMAETNIKLLEKQVAIAEQNEAIAENMTPEEIANLNKLLASGEIDIEGMVNRVVEKYAQDILEKERQNRTDDGK